MFVNELSASNNYSVTQVAHENQGNSVSIQRCDSDAAPVIINEAKGCCTECTISLSKLSFYCKHTIVYLAHTQGCTVHQIKLNKTKIANRYSYVADIVQIKSLGGKLHLFLNLYFMHNSLSFLNFRISFENSRINSPAITRTGTTNTDCCTCSQ